ncbi:MAG: 6-phosphogluconolactonase, partial [Clostridium sp.]|nr:6-phosphogluconolactonase [Clostridium sp.]
YMQPKEVIEFVSNAPDIQQELDKMDMFLREHPIDVMILGLGMNGHLGLNEPADSLVLNAHFAELDEKTKTHDMVKGYAPKGGLTIGLQGIFTAKQIIMLVCGERKEEAYQAFMSQRISTSTPASLLWLHPNCVTLVDDTIQK